MLITIKANERQREEWLSKNITSNANIIWIDEHDSLLKYTSDVYFDLQFNEEEITQNEFLPNGVVFANAVIATCAELPDNYIRINAWDGFLRRDIVEIAAPAIHEKNVVEVMSALNWKCILVHDTPGMIAPRIISMIINEAYFGLGEEISTKTEIDTAMKLGTNYPYGPFEWSEKIGLGKIYLLLKKLSEQDARYNVAQKMEEEIKLTAQDRE